jgi:hypothetical protein
MAANIANNLLRGDEKYVEAMKNVNTAVDNYTRSLVSLSAKHSVKLLEQGKEMQNQIQALSYSVQEGFGSIVRPLQTMVGIIPTQFSLISSGTQRLSDPSTGNERRRIFELAFPSLLDRGIPASLFT